VTVTLFRAIAEEGLTIAIGLALSLLILFSGVWWFAGVSRVRAVFAKALHGASQAAAADDRRMV